MSGEKEGKRVRSGEEELGGAVRYTTWYAVTLRRGYAAVSVYRPRHGTARHGAARLDATRRGAVCHAVVLPADIFIGGRTTCNRLRGIRTERCFVHLYPRFAARPIQRQPSLYPFSLYRASLLPPSSLLRRSHTFLSSRLSSSSPAALSVSAPATAVRAMPLKRPRIVLSDIEQR